MLEEIKSNMYAGDIYLKPSESIGDASSSRLVVFKKDKKSQEV